MHHAVFIRILQPAGPWQDAVQRLIDKLTHELSEGDRHDGLPSKADFGAEPNGSSRTA
jgi:hypothetical protein